MEEGRSQADANVQQAEKALEALQAITRSVATINQMNTQIATTAEQQSAVARDIDNSIDRINSGSREAAAQSEETQRVTEQLGELANNLQQVVQQFKLAGDDHFDFDSARSAHMAWKARLRAFLDGQSSLSHSEAVSHRDCVLGKWYYSTGLEKFGQLSEMRELEPHHEELHAVIREIIALKQAGDETAAEAAFDRVEVLSGQIIELLDGIEAQISVRVPDAVPA